MPPSPLRIFSVPFGCALALAAGIGGSRSLTLPALLYAAISMAGFALFFLSRAFRRPASPAAISLLSSALVLGFAGAGASIATSRHQSYLATSLLQRFAAHATDSSSAIRVQGWVAGDPVAHAERLRFLFEVERVRTRGGWVPGAGLVRISLRNPSAKARIRYGERLELPLRLYRGRNFRNPGAFDYVRSLEGDGVHLLGSLKSDQLAVRWPERNRRGLLPWVHRLRISLLGRLARAFPGPEGEESRRFLGAILLGQRDGGEGRLDALLRKSGTYHILSISGLHFALLLAMVGRISRRLPAGDRLEAPLLLGIGGLYLLLAGPEDPLLRCAVAILVQVAGRWTARKVSAWDAQALAAIGLLVARPLHLFQPGFQLSFLATFGILAWGNPWWARLRKVPLVGDSLAVSLGAWMASTPVMAVTFFQVSPVAMLMNLLAAPFLSLSLVAGIVSLCFPLRAGCALFEDGLRGFGRACELALAIPASFLRVPPPSLVALGTLAALSLGRLHLGSAARRPERIKFGTVILACLLLIAFPPMPWMREDLLTLTVLDVGQGDALILSLPGGHHVLVDAGGFAATDFDVGERIVLPALLTMGVRRLDVAVLTHAHQDHGGGLAAVLEALPPRALWFGRSPPDSSLIRRLEGTAMKQRIPWFHPTRGSVQCLGETCLEVIHPPFGYRRGEPVSNDDSLVLRLTYRSSSALLTGDLEADGESLVLGSGLAISAQVLKVAHHGSGSSTSARLLDRVAPGMAIVSVGEGNAWGHPSDKVMRRLRERQVEVLRTDRDGAIQLVTGGLMWERRQLRP